MQKVDVVMNKPASKKVKKGAKKSTTTQAAVSNRRGNLI